MANQDCIPSERLETFVANYTLLTPEAKEFFDQVIETVKAGGDLDKLNGDHISKEDVNTMVAMLEVES